MALSLILDPPIRLIVEPGYDQRISTAQSTIAGDPSGSVAGGMPSDAYSAASLWADPEMGVIMLKPQQLDPNFVNHQAQLDTGAVLELGSGLHANSDDIVNRTIYTGNVG